MSHGDPHSTTHAPATGEAGFDLFLSYNSLDRESVQRIRHQLGRRHVSTFFDRQHLTYGAPWFDELQDAIGKSWAVAVFVGAGGLGTWQKREVVLALGRQAKAEQGGDRFLVIPVLLPEAEVREAPGLLLLNTWLDLRGGIDDEAKLDALARAVRGAPGALPVPSAPPLPPYRDLRSFREEDAPLFFGREAFARELLERVRAHRLVAVVGTSGSGKSSVVQAGLLPLLRLEPPPRHGWDAITFTPGANPFHNLALSLVSLWEKGADRTTRVTKAGELGNSWAAGAPLAVAFNETLGATPGTDRLLVVVDQFEELFTLTPANLRRPFVDALLEASKTERVAVVLTLRADFYGQAIGLSRELSDLMQRGLVNLGPMTRGELQRSIEQPARQVGLKFEDGLAERILDHVEGQPGSLPLLEFALTELWLGREGGLLTNGRYKQVGGVEGAISKRADEQLAQLPPDEQAALLRFMTRLVRVSAADEEGTDTRQRVALGDLDAATRASVELFVRARLLVKGRDEATHEETVEVAHEALIRKWSRLREQLNKDREFLLWRQLLGQRFDEWERTRRDQGSLLRGATLAEARRHLKERRGDLNPSEREYIAASERNERRPKRWAAAAAAALCVALLGAAGWWLWYRSDAKLVGDLRAEALGLMPDARQETVNEWVAALALAGRPEESLATAWAVPPPHSPAQAACAAAEALHHTGRTEDARRALDRALEIAEKENTNLALRGHTFLVAAEKLLKWGRTDEAVGAARKALGAYTESKRMETAFVNSGITGTDFKYRLMEVFIRAGHTEGALTFLEGPTRAADWTHTWELLIKLKRFDEAKTLAYSLMRDGHFVKARWGLVGLKRVVTALGDAGGLRDVQEIGETVSAALAHTDYSPAYATASEIFIEIGDVKKAELAAARAVTFTGEHNGAVRATGAKALARAGAMDEVRALLEGPSREQLRIAIVSGFAESGRREEATRVAEEAIAAPEEQRWYSSDDLKTFLRVLIESGKSESALGFIRKIKIRFDDVNGLFTRNIVSLTRELLESGRAREAWSLADQTIIGVLSVDLEAPGFETRPFEPVAEQLHGLVELYVRAGKGSELGHVLTTAEAVPVRKSRLLLTLAESLAAAGQKGEAEYVLAEALSEIGRITSASDINLKLSLVSRAAKLQARLGLLREAAQNSEGCLPDDKLSVYAEALLEHARPGDEGLKKALRSARGGREEVGEVEQ